MSREVLFEFTRIGSVVRVAALDPATGVEVVVVGPASAARADLERLALRKLARQEAEARPAGARPPGRLA